MRACVTDNLAFGIKMRTERKKTALLFFPPINFLQKMEFAVDRLSGRLVRLPSLTRENRSDHDLVCLECHEPVIVKIGDLKAKHFAHKVDTSGKRACHFLEKNTSQHGETTEHLVGKKLLCEFLRDGGTVGIRCNCCRCERTRVFLVSKISTKAEHVANEVGGPGYIADIALFDVHTETKQREVKCIIEVRMTHATALTTTRPDPWFEVDARQVYDKLSSGAVDAEPLLLDSTKAVRAGMCGVGEESSCVSMKQTALALGYAKEKPTHTAASGEMDASTRKSGWLLSTGSALGHVFGAQKVYEVQRATRNEPRKPILLSLLPTSGV